MSQKQIAEKALRLKQASQAPASTAAPTGKAAALDFADYPDNLLTESEASEVLGLAPQTLSNWRSTGKGPRFVRIGTRTIRYPKSALEEFAHNELNIREPADELSDAEIIKQIARLANRLVRRQRQPAPEAA
jgi:predicted DNA-binding transcriptional regulator AlpA